MKVLAIAFATLMLVLTASAQDSLELSGGYMYSHLSAQGTSQDANTGWDASLNVPLFSSKSLGVLFETNAAYGGADLDNITLYTYGGGLQYSVRAWKAIQPFVNFTVGDASFHQQYFTTNKLDIAVGGGVDFHLMGGLYARGGVNYLHTGLPEVHGVGLNGVRVIGGLSYRF